MNTPTKQTVYLPVEGKSIDEFMENKEGYFFTPEQLNEYTANVIEFNMTTCSKNGIKKEGESCSLNNNCIYPDCLEKTFTRRDMLDFGMWAVQEYIKTSTLAKPGEYIINTMQDRLEQFLKSKQ